MTRLKNVADPTLISVVLASLVALGAVVFEAPGGVRLIAAAVLLLVPGIALLRLLLPRDEALGSDQALVVPLSALLGVLAWLGSAMLLNGLGIALRPKALALTITAIGLALAGLAITQASRGERPVASARGAVGGRMRATAAVLATAVLIGGAAALAVKMIPTPSPRYTALAFVDSKPYGDGAIIVTTGSMIRLNWVMRGFGLELSPALTSVRLSIDGVPVRDVAVDVSPLTEAAVDGSSGSISGAVTFPAPRKPGRHTVEVVVLPTAADGSDVPAPGFVSTLLEVKK